MPLEPITGLASEILDDFGIAPSNLMKLAWSQIVKIGDRKKALVAVRAIALIDMEYTRALSEALYGKDPETARAVQDALIRTHLQVMGLVIKAADPDGDGKV